MADSAPPRRPARLPRMRLLALETATLAGGAALLDDGRLVGESRLNIALTHSERLMAVVDRLLQDCGGGMSTLRGPAVAIARGTREGPGPGPRPAHRAGPDARRPRRHAAVRRRASVPAARRAQGRDLLL